MWEAVYFDHDLDRLRELADTAARIGVERFVLDDGWFLSLHCFTRYVKVTFFRGASLEPPPDGRSKYPAVRYLDIHEGAFDEDQFADWVKQASRLPGERM